LIVSRCLFSFDFLKLVIVCRSGFRFGLLLALFSNRLCSEAEQ
jgi:hypothetical protein